MNIIHFPDGISIEKAIEMLSYEEHDTKGLFNGTWINSIEGENAIYYKVFGMSKRQYNNAIDNRINNQNKIIKGFFTQFEIETIIESVEEKINNLDKKNHYHYDLIDKLKELK